MPRSGYPAISVNIWWKLRERFVNAPPKEVTREYLANALDLSLKNAANVMPAIRQVGLVDDSNRPTALAAQWRDDTTYAEACRTIIDQVYPTALTDVSPPDNVDTIAAARWFLNETQSGAPRARQLAAFYALLAKGELPGTSDKATRAATQARPARAARGEASQGRRASEESHRDNGRQTGFHPAAPTVSIAIQVYLDKNMDADQIDAIFKSMATHLYGRD